MLGLQWDDVDWPRNRLHLALQISAVTLRPERLKGRKKPEHRLIDVPSGAMEMLEELQAAARVGVPWVFATSNGTHYLCVLRTHRGHPLGRAPRNAPLGATRIDAEDRRY